MEAFGAKVMPQLARRYGDMSGIGGSTKHVAAR
jgi:hypothetical protein